MSRMLVCFVLLAGFAAFAYGPHFVSSPVANADVPAKPAAAKADAGSTQGLVETLLKPASYPGQADPKRTLAEELDTLAKRSKFSFVINERAFKSEGFNEVQKAEIAQTPLPAMTAPLSRILTRILNRVAVSSGATFMVREDGIEITTRDALSREVSIERHQFPYVPPVAGAGGVPNGMGFGGGLGALGALGGGALGAVGGGGMLGGALGAFGGGLGALGGAGAIGGLGGAAPVNPLDDETASKRIQVSVVQVALERQPFDEALRQIRTQANTNLVLDPALGEKVRTSVTITLLNAPIDSAMRVLTEMVELDFVWLDNIYYITTREKAQKLRKSWPNRRSGGEVNFQEGGEMAPGM